MNESKSKSDTSNTEVKEDINRFKFKVWDTENNCWYEPTYEAYAGRLEELLLSPSGDLTMRTFESGTRREKLIHESMFPNRFKIVWFTGLTDIEGTEVFEGDIMKGKIHTGVVERGIFGIDPNQAVGVLTWIVRAANGGFALTCDADYRCKDRVIGNVFEHSYLLEQK